LFSQIYYDEIGQKKKNGISRARLTPNLKDLGRIGLPSMIGLAADDPGSMEGEKAGKEKMRAARTPSRRTVPGCTSQIPQGGAVFGGYCLDGHCN